jgi:hypothetical protein
MSGGSCGGTPTIYTELGSSFLPCRQRGSGISARCSGQPIGQSICCPMRPSAFGTGSVRTRANRYSRSNIAASRLVQTITRLIACIAEIARFDRGGTSPDRSVATAATRFSGSPRHAGNSALPSGIILAPGSASAALNVHRLRVLCG